jgi:hypothetical protein
MVKPRRPRKSPGMASVPPEKVAQLPGSRIGLSRVPLPDEPYCEICAWPKRLCICTPPIGPSNDNVRGAFTIADEIRKATARNELHPFVRDNRASPRGLCNCSKQDATGSVFFCVLDYGHQGKHVNGEQQWEAPWPP